MVKSTPLPCWSCAQLPASATWPLPAGPPSSQAPTPTSSRQPSPRTQLFALLSPSAYPYRLTQPQIAKIETEDGLRNLDELMEASDAVMLARGKLGMVVTPEKVALAQCVVVTKANVAGACVRAGGRGVRVKREETVRVWGHGGGADTAACSSAATAAGLVVTLGRMATANAFRCVHASRTVPYVLHFTLFTHAALPCSSRNSRNSRTQIVTTPFDAPCCRQARHHLAADAGEHGGQPAPHTRRDDGRGQRRAGRRLGPHAVLRDRVRHVPRRLRRHRRQHRAQRRARHKLPGHALVHQVEPGAGAWLPEQSASSTDGLPPAKGTCA